MARKGFTLIELLIVIAIIAITMAILLPVLFTAKRRGNDATCQSNLHQIGLAIQMYQQDYDGYIVPKYNCIAFDPFYPDHCVRPRRGSNAVLEGGVAEWGLSPDAPPGTHYLLEPYVKNDDIFKCPVRDPGQSDDPNSGGRYTINAWDSLWGQGNPETGPQGQEESRIVEPSGTIIVMEHKNHAGECQAGQEEGVGDLLGKVPGHWETAHSEGFNSLWCDFHVHWMKESQLRRNMFNIQKLDYTGNSGGGNSN